MKIGTCPFLKEGYFLDFQCSSFKWPLPTMRSLIRSLRVNKFCSFPDSFNSSSNVLCFSVFPIGPESLWQFRSPRSHLTAQFSQLLAPFMWLSCTRHPLAIQSASFPIKTKVTFLNTCQAFCIRKMNLQEEKDLQY